MKNKAGKNRANPLGYLFSKTWRYSEGQRKVIMRFSAMFIIAEGVSMVLQPLIIATMMNVVQKQGLTGASVKFLLELLMLGLVVELFFWSLHGPARVMERVNAFTVRANYRKYLTKGILTLPMEWQVEHHSGDTIDKIEKGTSALFDFSQDSFEFIYAAVQFAVSYGMLIYISRPSAYIVLVAVVVTVWIIMRFDRVLIGQYGTLNRSENAVSESIIDAVTNITTVIILRVERLVFEAIARRIDKPYDLFKENARLSEIKWCLMNICCRVMTIAVLGVYFVGHVGSPQKVLFGSVYLLFNYLQHVSDLFSQFCARYSEVLRRASRVMNAEELAADFRAENFTNHVLPKDWQTLQIDDLSFSYTREEDGEQHLDNLSLSLVRGQKIALVGESGSGKTTLLKIMRDLYHPRSIRLSVDGKGISQGFEGIHRAITLIPQDPELFAKTIFENITVGAEHDLAFVRQFTDMACLTDVIDGLPNGFNSFIQEKGVNLSGGQRQRLALARGLLACHDKDMVLLDEPTSSVDTANEMRIYQNIFREFGGKTIVSSIHRLHLLPLFDCIYFMSNGQITASGSLNELLNTCPEFQGLWRQYHESNYEAATQ